MRGLATLLVIAVVIAGVGGFTLGYLLHPQTTTITRVVPQTVALSDYNFTCGPSSQSPYLEGALQFNLSSTYRTDVIASVAYLGNWTGDTNQLVRANGTKHVTVTWGPGAMQSIQVPACPNVNVTIWRVVQLLMTCPNPPCDDGTTPAP